MTEKWGGRCREGGSGWRELQVATNWARWVGHTSIRLFPVFRPHPSRDRESRNGEPSFQISHSITFSATVREGKKNVLLSSFFRCLIRPEQFISNMLVLWEGCQAEEASRAKIDSAAPNPFPPPPQQAHSNFPTSH